MPPYEYICKDCAYEFTVFLSIREFEGNPKIRCPHCQNDNVQEKISAFTLKQAKNYSLCRPTFPEVETTC